MLLKDKIAIVTGGSRGIGKAIVECFLEEGATVYSLSTRESPYSEELESKAAQSGGTYLWKQGDVTDEVAMLALVEEILKERGRIDVLVNNAGITRDGLFFRMNREDWDQVLLTNLTSAFILCRPIARQMTRQRSGSIINLSSVVGIKGNGGQVNYSASKAGIIGFTKSLAREVASRGVRVNALAPGFIETSMTDKIPEEAKKALESQIPLGRTGKPEEVAKAALFLASDLSLYITGQVLGVDGGMGM